MNTTHATKFFPDFLYVGIVKGKGSTLLTGNLFYHHEIMEPWEWWDLGVYGIEN